MVLFTATSLVYVTEKVICKNVMTSQKLDEREEKGGKKRGSKCNDLNE